MPAPFTQDTILVTSPNGGGTSLVDHDGVIVLDRFDATGLWLTPDMLLRNAIVGTQECRRMQLQAFSAAGKSVLREDSLFDFHDILCVGDTTYLVSTGSNEVLCLDRAGTLIRRHAFPGAHDSWHINCLGLWDERVVLSAFGEFDSHRGYKQHSRGQGFVMDLASGEKLWTGLSQPHTPVQHGTRYWICNSEEKQVLARSTSGEVHCLKFDGYTRGLAFGQHHLYVGLSASRNIPADRDKARIVALSLDTLQPAGERLLPFAEIYDLRILTPAMRLLPLYLLSHQGQALQQALETQACQVRWLEQQLAQFRRVCTHPVAGRLIALLRLLKRDPGFGQPDAIPPLEHDS